MAVYNPIFQGFEWNQAFDLPTGTLLAGDTLRAEFRRKASDSAAVAVVSTGSGITVTGNRVLISLSETQTAVIKLGEVKTNLVIERGDGEIPIGQVITIPVEQLPTRPAA